MPDNFVVIRGLAHRGACDPEIAGFVAGATPVGTSLPVYPQLNQHVSIGGATVDVQENGDVVVEATISQASWLINNPFLALTIEDPEDGPRKIIQVAVTDSVIDPFQLPYRIIDFPEDIEQEFAHRYEPVVEIDEQHDAQVQLGNDGSMHPIFDMTKSHVELRHRTERQRLAIPDAVARAHGYDSWAQVVSLDEAAEFYIVIREIMGVL